MLEDFEVRDVEVGEVRIRTAVSGQGPAVLLLHGYPETHVMWHQVAPRLAERNTIVLTDLRGYGDSSRPPPAPDHASYAKRTMAADQVGVMGLLGFETFAVIGHDRGARVAHRMCLDHPDRVSQAAFLDIVPTLHVLDHVDRRLAQTYYHWFFLAQEADLPERMIGSDPEYYLRRKLDQWSACGIGGFAPEAVDEYVRCFSDPAVIRATCEDYRAGSSIDLEHDGADRVAGRRVACPVLALWGSDGFVGRTYDVVGVWQTYATDVRGAAVAAGHFPAEESPDATLAELQAFLGP